MLGNIGIFINTGILFIGEDTMSAVIFLGMLSPGVTLFDDFELLVKYL